MSINKTFLLSTMGSAAAAMRVRVAAQEAVALVEMARIDKEGSEADRMVNRIVRYHYWLSYANVRVMEQTAAGLKDEVEKLKEEVIEKEVEFFGLREDSLRLGVSHRYDEVDRGFQEVKEQVDGYLDLFKAGSKYEIEIICRVDGVDICCIEV